MCSGTDVPVLAVVALQLALDTAYSLRWNFGHCFSCELSQSKRLFIEKFVPGVANLFGDCTKLGATAWCFSGSN